MQFLNSNKTEIRTNIVLTKAAAAAAPLKTTNAKNHASATPRYVVPPLKIELSLYRPTTSPKWYPHDFQAAPFLVILSLLPTPILRRKCMSRMCNIKCIISRAKLRTSIIKMIQYKDTQFTWLWIIFDYQSSFHLTKFT